MSSNISIGGTETHNKSIQGGNLSANLTSSNVPKAVNVKSIHNTEEVKQAERKGDNIPISDEQLIRAIERAIKSIQGPTTSLDFSVHKDTKKIMVKVLDKETGEIIREIPPEKNLDLLAKLWEMAGILVDERR